MESGNGWDDCIFGEEFLDVREETKKDFDVRSKTKDAELGDWELIADFWGFEDKLEVEKPRETLKEWLLSIVLRYNIMSSLFDREELRQAQESAKKIETANANNENRPLENPDRHRRDLPLLANAACEEPCFTTRSSKTFEKTGVMISSYRGGVDQSVLPHSRRNRLKEEKRDAKLKEAVMNFSTAWMKTIPPPREVAKFELTDSCKLVIQGGDITRWFKDGHSDAIVNAANELMLGGGGVDGAIHDAAGPDLYKACKTLPLVAPRTRCPVGQARETPAFRLPVRRIIHTVGPTYHRSTRMKAAALLRDAYCNSLELAREKGVKCIAFPAISCGIYGYPVYEGAEIALRTVSENAAGFEEVHFVLMDKHARQAWLKSAQRNLDPRFP